MKLLSQASVIFLLIFLVAPVVGEEVLPADTNKTIIQHYHIKGDTITYLDSRVVYSHCSNLFDLPDDYTGRVLGPGNETLNRFGISDPRITFMDTGAKVTDDINFTVNVPMSKKISAVGIYYTDNDTLIVRGDVSKAVRDFCAAHPRDPDCSDGLPWMLLIGAVIIVLIVVSGMFWYTKRKKKTG